MKSEIKNKIESPFQSKYFLGGEPLVFHCNHYNLALQKTLLTPTYIDMVPTLIDSATEVAHNCLSNLRKSLNIDTPEKTFELAREVFQLLGFGLINFSGVAEQGGEIFLPVSHYGTALKIANHNENFSSPQSFFDLGFSLGALSVAYEKPSHHYWGEILECPSVGQKEGRIKIYPREKPSEKIPFSVEEGIQSFGPIPGRSLESNIDEEAVIKTVSGLDFDGDEEGLIHRFGVILTRHFANYYNRISFVFATHLSNHRGMRKAAQPLLQEAGHVCGFYTFGGIMKSDEWHAVVHPMCKTREDWVHGMVAVVNTLGWGVWRVAELVPGKRLVMRIYNGYESSGYLGMYGKSQVPVEDLAMGAVSALMNLVYRTEIHTKPELTPDLYNYLFGDGDMFQAEQVKCRSMGDEYSEIVAER